MKHLFVFSGKQVDLAKNDKVKQLEKALANFYPKAIVQLKYYDEIDDKTFELEVSRNYKGSASIGLDKCINYHDMSIITGLNLSAFEPWGDPMIGSLIPWSDGMVYCPDQVFEDLYIRQNEIMVQEKIKRICFHPTTNYIKIHVEYE